MPKRLAHEQRPWRLAAVAVAAATIAAFAALHVPRGEAHHIETVTRGKICSESCGVERLFSVAGYDFQGRTTPSIQGQKVRFHYKRQGAKRWRRFGDGGFQVLAPSRDRPFDLINRKHRWKIHFTPQRVGRYVVRAMFPRQDGFSRSAVRKRVRVLGSE